MNAQERNTAANRVNAAIRKLPTYSEMMPWIEQVTRICKDAGFTVDTSGIYCGEVGSAKFEAVEADGRVKRWLTVTWYKMNHEDPARWHVYEMLGYLS